EAECTFGCRLYQASGFRSPDGRDPSAAGVDTVTDGRYKSSASDFAVVLRADVDGAGVVSAAGARGGGYLADREAAGPCLGDAPGRRYGGEMGRVDDDVVPEYGSR